MLRRDFLGSLIGIYAVTLIPYVAHANPLPQPKFPSRKIQQLDIGHRIFIRDDINTLHRYTFNLLTLVNGQVIEIVGPKIAKIECDKRNGKSVFTAESVNIKHQISVKGLALISDKGEKLIEADYFSIINFQDGDTLKQTYMFSI